MKPTPSDRILEYVSILCRQASPSTHLYVDPQDVRGTQELPLTVIEDDGVSEEVGVYGHGINKNTFVFTVSFVTGVYAQDDIPLSMSQNDLRRWARFTGTRFKQLMQEDWSLGGLVTDSQLGDLLKIDTQNSDYAGSEITCRAIYTTADGDPFTLPCDTTP